MNTENEDILIENLRVVLQKIQDKTISRPELATFDMRDHSLYWELGTIIKKIISLHSISEEHIVDYILTNFKDIEKKIRNDGKRKNKESFPTWYMESKVTKQLRVPSKPWILLSWEFVNEYQDIERWNLISKLAGHRFKDKNGNTLFTRKFAEDLIHHFSKKNPPSNAKKLQQKFIKEVNRFDKKPSRESVWEPLLKQIFGKSKIDLMLINEKFFSIRSDIDELMNDENFNSRQDFTKNIGLDALNTLRRLLRLISLTDEIKFQKRVNQLADKLPKYIKTKNSEVKQLYVFIHPLIKDPNSRKKLLKRISSYELSLLNTKLQAISDEKIFQEYKENQKLKEKLFS